MKEEELARANGASRELGQIKKRKGMAAARHPQKIGMDLWTLRGTRGRKRSSGRGRKAEENI